MGECYGQGDCYEQGVYGYEGWEYMMVRVREDWYILKKIKGCDTRMNRVEAFYSWVEGLAPSEKIKGVEVDEWLTAKVYLVESCYFYREVARLDETCLVPMPDLMRIYLLGA